MITPKKLVCIFAHPDDEAFGPSGSIAYLSGNCEVHIICVTKGDADEEFAKGNNIQTLADVRAQELDASAKILGVKTVTHLGFKDGGLNNNNYHKVTEEVKNILEKIKPDTLLTFDPNGVSGHLDHIAVSMETTYLFERLDFVKNLMYFCEPEGVKKIIGKDYFVYYPEGYNEKQVDWIIDVSDHMDKKISAINAHVSQRSDASMILTTFKPFLEKEYFRVLTK